MLILTYNIHAGLGIDRRRSLTRIAKVLRDSEADVACLQEVDQRLPRSRFVDQAKWLGDHLGMGFVFQRNLSMALGGFGNLILTRYPIIGTHALSLTSFDEQRGLLLVEMETPLGRLNVFCTHWGLSADERVVQSAETAAFLNASSSPKILCGDLNDTEESPSVAGLISSAGLRDLAAEAGVIERTFPSSDPMARIDYVLGSECLGAVTAAVIDSPASDHRAVAVDVQLN